MAMNFAPLDCPCQGASSESKKIYLDFFILEKIAKKQKNPYFWLIMSEVMSSKDWIICSTTTRNHIITEGFDISDTNLSQIFYIHFLTR
jgi:hypothetical protein